MRNCIICLEVKDVYNFYIKNNITNRLDSTCKKCRNINNLQNHYKNREKRLLNKKEYYIKNKERLYKKGKEWSDKNPELNKIYKKKWKQNNKDKLRADDAFRHARKMKATPPWLTKEHKEEIQILYSFAQALSAASNIQHDIDHIVPLRGKNVSGLHVPWNLTVMDHILNVKKGNRYESK